MKKKILRLYLQYQNWKQQVEAKKKLNLRKVQQNLSLKWNRMLDGYFSEFFLLFYCLRIHNENFFTCLSLSCDLHYLCKFIAESYSKSKNSFEGTNNSFLCIMLNILWLQITSKNFIFTSLSFMTFYSIFLCFMCFWNWICLTWFQYGKIGL